MFLFLFSCILFTFFPAYLTINTLISLKQGLVRGTTEKSIDGTFYNAFYGIPYARPPIGEFRFKPPVKAQPWVGILNATKEFPICIQVPEFGNNVEGSEDCLNLIVYSPLNAKSGDNLPVIVYLFGGKLLTGDNYKCKPCYKMYENTVVVMPNYRLGVMGLLSTGDTIVSGNMALKDQTMALRWIRQNIRSFGGNPGRVTLHGHSSGAICAHLHMFSSLSKGLFHRIILQSGVGIYPSAYYSREIGRNTAFEFGKQLGCRANNSETLLKCLMTAKAEDLCRTQAKMYLWQNYPQDAAFRPTIEDENVKDAFLSHIPILASYQDTNVTMMVGMTSGEGAGAAVTFNTNGEDILNQLNNHYETIFPIIFSYHWTAKCTDRRYISRLLKTRYFNNASIGIPTIRNFMNMFTDLGFGSGILEVPRNYKGSKYVYLYDYSSNYSSQNVAGYFPERIGISHADDIGLTYCKNISFDSLSTRDLAFAHEWVTRIVNFAHSGDPNRPYSINRNILGEWKPALSSRIEYMYLNFNGTMRTGFGEDAYNFLKTLPLNSRFLRKLKSKS